MLTAQYIKTATECLIAFCEENRLPQTETVRYSVLFRLLETPYENAALSTLRPAFLHSDIVEELYQQQSYTGGWGRLFSKDYSAKDVFPCSAVAIARCQYIGLTKEDRGILFNANEYLESFLNGTSQEKFIKSNERVLPWNTAAVCNMLEALTPNNPLCDRTIAEWQFIAGRAFENGEYSYEKESAAQHEVFWTRENRLVPMQTELLLKRRAELPPGLEEAMLRHYGEHVYHHGHF